MTSSGLMSVEELEKDGLLERLIKANPGTKDPKAFKQHSYDSAMIIADVLDRALFHYPDEFDLQIDRKEIEVSSYLHDIGRVFKKNQVFHELRGGDFIELEGLRFLGKDLTEKHKKVLYRIAETIRSHFVVFEQFTKMKDEYKEEIEAYRIDVEGFKSRNPDLYENAINPVRDPFLLLPTTWNQKFIVYAELSNLNGKKMTPQERMIELEERYSTNPKYKDERFLKAFSLGKERIYTICDTVDELVKGKLPNALVKRYGFLK